MVVTTCPSCGRKVPLPADFKGGTVSCPNADCAQAFEARAGGSRPPSGTAKGSERRRPGSRPELLDRLPTSFWISPPMYLIGGVFVMLYGLVFAGIVSSWKQQPLTESVASVEYAPARVPSDAIHVVSNDNPPSTSKTEPKPPPASAEVAKKPDAPKVPEPAPEPEPSRPKPKQTKAKAEIARATPAKAEETPRPPPPTQPVTWGELKGDRGDAELNPQGAVLAVNVPGTLHILSPDLKSKNAPRLVTPVRGDFTATVKVIGRISPGTNPLPLLPFTFQGAGLLVWENEDHYLRLERTGSYSSEGKKHMVLEEYVKDNKTAPNGVRDARVTDLTLRIERRGSELRCAYSPDQGKTWLEVKRQATSFPAEVQVGVSIANASPKPFAITLENFQLTAGGAKGGK